MNYLDLKVLFCKQLDNSIFAIINVLDNLTSEYRVIAVSLPSQPITLQGEISLETDYEIEAYVCNSLRFALESDIQIDTTYTVDLNSAIGIHSKIKEEISKIKPTHLLHVLDGIPIYLELTKNISLDVDTDIDFTFASTITPSIDEDNFIDTSYTAELLLLTLMQTSIIQSFSITTTHSTAVMVVKYVTLYALKDYTLNDLGDYSLFSLSYKD